MGKGGFRVVDFSDDLDVNLNTNWLSSDFQLPEEYPDSLMTFLHFTFSLTTDAIVSVIRNGQSFVLNNGVQFKGEGFRSIAISRDESINIQCDQTQANAIFTLALEE